MRRAEIRIERLEHRMATRRPECVTVDWLIRQPKWQWERVLDSLPEKELDRLIKQPEADIEAADEKLSAQT